MHFEIGNKFWQRTASLHSCIKISDKTARDSFILYMYNNQKAQSRQTIYRRLYISVYSIQGIYVFIRQYVYITASQNSKSKFNTSFDKQSASQGDQNNGFRGVCHLVGVLKMRIQENQIHNIVRQDNSSHLKETPMFHPIQFRR